MRPVASNRQPARCPTRGDRDGATRRDLLVIPVLVGDAAMPRREHLPRDLAALAECNALRITDEGYEHEVERLTRTLDQVVNQRHTVPTPPPRVDLRPPVPQRQGRTAKTRWSRSAFMTSTSTACGRTPPGCSLRRSRCR